MRYDAQVNVTIEVPDKEAFIAEWCEDDEELEIEDAIAQAIEFEQPTFELGLTGASGFMVAADKVSYLDG